MEYLPQSERVLGQNTDTDQQFLHELRQKAAGNPVFADVKAALIVGGGGMRGAAGASASLVLEQAGLTAAFDYTIGTSTGNFITAYAATNQIGEACDLYHTQLAKPEFIRKNPRNVLGGTILDSEYLHQVITDTHPLDSERLAAARTTVILGMTDVEMAQPAYIHIGSDNVHKLGKYLIASAAVPGGYHPQSIDGRLYADGISTCINSIAYALDALECTHVLSIINGGLRPSPAMRGSERLASLAAPRLSRHPRKLRNAHQRRFIGNDEIATTLYPSAAKIGIIALECAENIHYLNRDPAAVKAVADEAREYTTQLLAA